MVAKESAGGKGPAKEFFYKENVPEESPKSTSRATLKRRPVD
jgi:hypothetical protein